MHANEALAIRYGIANTEEKIKGHYYYKRGGVKVRNASRDITYYEPASTIRLQKNRKIGRDHYEVLLVDRGNKKAIAVIEPGTEYVKSFYPLDEDWFKKYVKLEEVLKDNGSFTLKELATFHVQKVA